jgi:hypothetical protein
MSPVHLTKFLRKQMSMKENDSFTFRNMAKTKKEGEEQNRSREGSINSSTTCRSGWGQPLSSAKQKLAASRDNDFSRLRLRLPVERWDAVYEFLICE